MMLTLNFNRHYASGGPGSGSSATSGGGDAGSGGTSGGGGTGTGGRTLASLKTAAVPGPTAAELSNVIRNKSAAIQLGKAFFWEMQFGSDGNTACATCHFNAGADSRSFNQTDPGLRRVDATAIRPLIPPRSRRASVPIIS